MIFCDLDKVLVNQTSRKRFDLMDWMPDGRELWAFLAPLQPTILSQLMADIYDVSKPEKLIWCARELGPDVRVIVVRGEEGKHYHSGPGHILIDDTEGHRANWVRRGGTFILHRTASESIAELHLEMQL